MTNKMEDILGLGPIEKERVIPGSKYIEGREYLYIEDDGSDNIELLFRKVIREITPSIAKSGGAITEGCKITLPSGEIFHSVSYKGDIEGWRQQIKEGAKALKLNIGKVEHEYLVLSNDTKVLLSECTVNYY